MCWGKRCLDLLVQGTRKGRSITICRDLMMANTRNSMHSMLRQLPHFLTMIMSRDHFPL